ncbi:MAG: A/G-specific adenine glycosylase, partial [bacterium]
MRPWPQRLLQWYAGHHRDLPWRGHPDPYAVWVSEIMLQQTRVETARGYFVRFLKRFPAITDLAAAGTADVLKHWEGLGYYSRARNLQAAARHVTARLGGRLPCTAAALGELPGIGPYTAAAIASICFGERVPVVDGNVARVFSRYLGWRDDFRKLPSRRKLADWLQPHMARMARPGDFNQAMMELGALICLPRTPACRQCPLAATCHARETGTQAELPARRERTSILTRHAMAVVIRRHSRVLLVQRRAGGLLGGFWELPGGEAARQPHVRAASAAACRQTGLSLSGLSACGVLTHTFSHFRLQLAIYRCRLAAGRIRGSSGVRMMWASPADLARLPVATAHRRALQVSEGAAPSTSPLVAGRLGNGAQKVARALRARASAGGVPEMNKSRTPRAQSGTE